MTYGRAPFALHELALNGAAVRHRAELVGELRGQTLGTRLFLVEAGS